MFRRYLRTRYNVERDISIEASCSIFNAYFMYMYVASDTT